MDDGENSLSQALKLKTALTSLNLNRSSIGLHQALRVNTSLISLDLSGTSVGDKGAYSLSQALRANTSHFLEFE